MKKTKTKYCKYHDICDKEINCFKGEYCAVFEHTDLFSSLRYREPIEDDRSQDFDRQYMGHLKEEEEER